MSRLATIASCIEKDSIVADIGCDHAYLPIILTENRISKKCYAMDNKKGPLEAAKKNIVERGFQEDIVTILSDGFDKLPDDVDTVVMAGMGFATVKTIIQNDIEKAKKLKRIVIQVNKQVEQLRRWLNEQSFSIVDEKIVEDGFIYQIVVVTFGTKNDYNDDDYMFGPLLKMEKSDCFVQYYKQQADSIEQLLQHSLSISKQTQLKNKLQAIKKILY